MKQERKIQCKRVGKSRVLLKTKDNTSFGQDGAAYARAHSYRNRTCSDPDR